MSMYSDLEAEPPSTGHRFRRPGNHANVYLREEYYGTPGHGLVVLLLQPSLCRILPDTV